jgi:gliding motility-associated protein GldM
MAVNSPNSPRQKMINLMYLVFIAMLALNVSAEVLDGFGLMEDSLANSSDISLQRNVLIMDELASYNEQNPEKAGLWYRRGMKVRQMSDSLFSYIETLKLKMVRRADGRKADLGNIRHKDDLNAASEVMLSPVSGEGRHLRLEVDSFRNTLSQLVTDENRRKIINSGLSTQPSSARGKQFRSWEQSLFEQMPVAAAVTLLTKLQSDVRSAEGETLSHLLNSVDVSDFRVNQINAYVIPESNIVIQGGTYKARIVLSAEDSTRHPSIFVNGSFLNQASNGIFSTAATSIGSHSIQGYVELPRADGSVLRRDFSNSYTVIEPMATVAPTLMNVLYAGIDNEISISVPGIAPQDINATMTNGSLVRKGNMWHAKPLKIGQNAVISITAKTGNQLRQLAKKEFRVRPLPDPAPYIEYTDANGNPVMFKGGTLSKSVLMNADGIRAAIDDGILNIPFRVLGFRTVFFDAMGNAIPEVSNGNRFSDRQKEQIRRLSRGKYFYISGVKAVGPDGIEREISVIEVRVN